MSPLSRECKHPLLWLSNIFAYEISIIHEELLKRDCLQLLWLTNHVKCGSYCDVYICSIKGCFLLWQNFSLIPNQKSGNVFRIGNPSKESEGIYTCVCTWEHHGIKHTSSGSRRLINKPQTISSPPKFLLPINNSIVIADVGEETHHNAALSFSLNPAMFKFCVPPELDFVQFTKK